MKIGVSLFVAAMGLAATGIAQSQSAVEGSARGQSNTEAQANGARGAAASQTSESAGSVATDQGVMTFEEGTELNAELTRGVDARRARPGDEVRARVTEDVESNGEIALERGTRLVGRVTEARPHGNTSADAAATAESQLGIVFEKAIIGRGQELPIHATIQALAAAEGEMQTAGQLVGSRADTRTSQSGSGFGSVSGGAGRTSGGVIGGAGGVVGGGAGAAGSIGGAVGGRVGGAAGAASGGAGNAGSQVGGSARGAAGATGTIYRSTNAVGGLDTAGRLGAGSRGVFGIDGLSIASRGAAGAGAAARTGAGQTNAVARAAGSANAGSNVNAAGATATVITSASGNVRLDSGTRMLLVASGSASGSASVKR
ncbi:MAG TPA: hypothetical protein VMR74_16870 [Gammaproteobacteria bacterium]|nr:hypothetical protein [Gammaproteobacteria bacterium]